MKIKSKTLTYITTMMSLIAFCLTKQMAAEYQITPGTVVEKVNAAVRAALKFKPAAYDTTSIIAGAIGLSAVWLMYLYYLYSSKNYLLGKEHGSAEWGNQQDIDKYIEIQKDNNILFTETEMMSINTRKTQRNNNVIVVGGSGSGKTRYYVMPNLMQLHSSYVVTDPKGEILRACGKLLAESGYKVKVFNLIDMKSSHRYNPFEYMKDEKDILKIINNLIVNTTSPQSRQGDEFWVKAETALLQALFAYIHYEGLPGEKNIGTVLKMLKLGEVREDEELYQSPLDYLFNDLKEKDPHHFAVTQYRIFKSGTSKTLKSILISLGVRLSPFYIKDVTELLEADDLELDEIGTRKTALFVVLPDSDRSFNFLAAMMYQQLFDVLFNVADTDYGGRLPIHVRFLLDEFPNIGQIPTFETYIATMRSREISANVILQNITQLKSIYEKTWETITGNADSLLFLGGNEQSTLDYLSKRCGKMTIDHRAINESRGQTGAYSMNYSVLGRDLITPDEIGRLPTDECIYFLRGEKPFKSKKYDLKKHPLYVSISDSGTSFDYERFKEEIEKKQKVITLAQQLEGVNTYLNYGLIEVN